MIPREMADETLQMLIEFSRHLEDWSIEAADRLAAEGDFPPLARLLDGLQTFNDGVRTSREVLGVKSDSENNLSDAELVSVLKDLLSSYETADQKYALDLLKDHLPANLRHWRESVIPTLIRSRDS